jgi:hypothetical protein
MEDYEQGFPSSSRKLEKGKSHENELSCQVVCSLCHRRGLQRRRTYPAKTLFDRFQVRAKPTEVSRLVFDKLFEKTHWLLPCLHRCRRPSQAATYAAMGENDAAFAELEKAYHAHDWFFQRLKVDPFMDPLRDDPRFKELVHRIGLSEMIEQ